MLIYVDDAFVTSNRGEKTNRQKIGKYSLVNKGSFGTPYFSLVHGVSEIMSSNAVKV